MIKVAFIIAFVLISFGHISLKAQETVAMTFTEKSFNASDAGKAGLSFCNNLMENNDTLNVSIGYLMWSPSYDPINSFNLNADYRIGKKIFVSLEGMYGLGREFDIYNSGGFKDGTYKPGQMLFGLGAEYRILDILTVKAKLKYMSENLAPEATYGAFGADMAATAIIPVSDNGKIIAQAGVFSIGTKVVSLSRDKYGLPSSVKIGVGYIHDLNKKNSISILAEEAYYFNNALGTAIGAEAKIADLVYFRAGYRLGAKYILPSFASIGAGIKFAGFSINATYLIASNAATNTVVLSIGYSL